MVVHDLSTPRRYCLRARLGLSADLPLPEFTLMQSLATRMLAVRMIALHAEGVTCNSRRQRPRFAPTKYFDPARVAQNVRLAEPFRVGGNKFRDVAWLFSLTL